MRFDSPLLSVSPALASTLALALVVLVAPAARAQTLTLPIDGEPSQVATTDAAPAVLAAPPPEVDEPTRIEAAVWVAGFVETVDLRGQDMPFQAPEIEALDGAGLSPGWAGNEALSALVVGGMSFGLGMRADGWLRGPELRVHVGGGSGDGAFAPVPNAAGFEAAVRSAFLVRVETAVGLQLELGPVVPYVQAIASVGGAFVDLEVRYAGLGRVGSETAAAALLGLGVEAGLEVPCDEQDEGPYFGLAFRGSFLGTPSYGGALTLGFRGD